jgi:hypothetical protein
MVPGLRVGAGLRSHGRLILAVYVDELRSWGWKIRGKTFQSCHLVADSLEELKAFGAKIGMKARWLQAPPKSSIPHFDLIPSKRAAALAAGAVELGRRAFVLKIREIRNRSQLRGARA